MSHFAISAVGADRPGIVAAVTGVLVDHDCNLEDTSMTILRGHFSMMLVVSAPASETADALEASLGDLGRRLGLLVAVRPIEDDVPESPSGAAYNLAVYGGDRPGIVHRVSSLLAARDVNIVDLTTRVIGEADRPVYVMVLDVTLPAGLAVETLEHDLGELGRDLGVECSLHPSEADVF